MRVEERVRSEREETRVYPTRGFGIYLLTFFLFLFSLFFFNNFFFLGNNLLIYNDKVMILIIAHV